MKKQVIIILLTIIFTTELAVMMLFEEILSRQPILVAGLIDATLLVLLVAYPLWLICAQFSKENSLSQSSDTDRANQHILLFIKILFTIYVIEYGIMQLTIWLPGIAGLGLAFVDAALTVLLLMPVFWLLLSKEERHPSKLSLSEVLGKPLVVLIALLYMVFIADIIQEIVQPYLSPDGYEEYFIIIDSLLTTLFIAPFFWLLIGRPITRGILSEKIRTKAVVDQLVEAVVSIDKSGHIAAMNPAAEKSFGLAAKNIIGQPVDVLFTEGQVSIQGLITRQRQDNPEAPEIKLKEVACKSHGNTNRIMDLSLSRIRDNNLDEWILILHDITRHKEAERAMLERDERFRQIFEQTNDAIAFFKPQTCNIIDVNKTFSDLFGYPKETIVKMGIDMLVADSDRDRVRKAIGKTAHNVHAQLESFVGLGHNHKKFNLSMHSKMMTIDGINIIYCSFRDITNRLLLEKEATEIQARLIQANKMTSLGQMVSTVAHEINNPNNFIRSNAILLNNSWEDAAKILRQYYQENGDFYLGGISFAELDQQVPQLFAGVLDGSKRINEIVNNLKTFYRSDKSEETSIDINKVAESAVSLLRHELVQYTRNFHLKLGTNLPTVSGNSQQLGQVIINLLMNACQALPDTESAIWLETLHDRDNGEVILKVRDQGRGISSTESQKIMEPFFTTKLDSGGTGLGLTICRSIIHSHRGTLEFSSVMGQGSTFIIRLPAEAAVAED